MLKFVLLIFSFTAVTSAEFCENEKDDHCMALDSPQNSFNQETDWSSAKTVYQFHAKDIHGNDVLLKKFNGSVLMIVNVASQCILTDSNYKKLVKLHEKYRDKGLHILAFPSNQFWGQEPGASEQILNFTKGYNAEFDVFEKIDVTGVDAHPLWKWLSTQQDGDTVDITWNFTKFIIDREGKFVKRVDPSFIFDTDWISVEKTLNEIFFK